MKRALMGVLALLIVIPQSRAEDNDEAMKLAVKLTTDGAATFDTKDAKAMAAYYTEDAQITVISKEKDTGTIKTEYKRGRGEVEEFYQTLFKDAGTINAKNTVEYARRIDPDVLLISGVFQPNTADRLKVPFHQVRVRQGDKWLMTNLQIYIVPQE
jgi:hypothetical protein